LAAAIAGFIAVEAIIFSTIPPDAMHNIVGGMITGYNWLIVLGAFMFVSFIANKWAVSSVSLQTQYFGLGIYVVAQSIIFVPLLYLASRYDPQTIPIAGILTGIIFGGLTFTVFITGAKLSWMGRYLALCSFAALGFIVCSILFGGIGFGLIFSTLMIALMAGYILYETSNVLHVYHTSQYVAAALALFASIATLFWYVLQLVMAFTGRD
jgi:FtsH-binding integral membrane protein